MKGEFKRRCQFCGYHIIMRRVRGSLGRPKWVAYNLDGTFHPPTCNNDAHRVHFRTVTA